MVFLHGLIFASFGESTGHEVICPPNHGLAPLTGP
jgi:hypothetical protein